MDCNFANLHDLETITGKGFRTLKKKLTDLEPTKVNGKGNFYNTKEALPLIYESRVPGDLDLTQERAKLANAQTEKTKLETNKLKDKYILVEDAERAMATVIRNSRAKLLLLPQKLAPDLKGIDDRRVIEDRLETYIHEALTELSQGELC